MIWDTEEGYLEYQRSLNNLKTTLGIKKFDYILRPELAPYVTRILQYLERNLIEKIGLDGPMIDKIHCVENLFMEGVDLIINENTRALASRVGYLLEDDIDDMILYNQEYFVFSWSNIMTNIMTRISIQYASLLYKPIIPGCPCECTRGDNQETWDNYTSGVWPEDENLDYSKEDSNKEKPNCTCNYRTV